MLIAFAGRSSAGKTTAIEFLARRGFGHRVYLGEAILEEIVRQGIDRTAESELAVRLDLRKRFGASALADINSPRVESLLRQGHCVLIDAIFNIEEYTRLLTCGQKRSVLVAIDASFATRLARQSLRRDRQYTEQELLERDRAESEDLRTPAVLARADFKLVNEETLDAFYSEVGVLWERISPNL